MANLPGSGTLYLSQIRDHFGGGNPIYLSQYYRGGGRVPDNSLNWGISTSGTISMGMFYNATNSSGVFPTANRYNLDLFRSNNGNLSDSVTVSVTGGTGSYSWSFGWASGGSLITLTGGAGSGANSSFSVSANGTQGQSRGGVVRATVTSGPFSGYVDVVVNMQWGQPV